MFLCNLSLLFRGQRSFGIFAWRIGGEAIF
jgi:hypothetical protein